MRRILFILFSFVISCTFCYADKIKYVFLIIGDGMSVSSEVALSRFLYGKDKMLFWNDFPYQHFMATWSLSSYQGDFDNGIFVFDKGYDTATAGVIPYPYYKNDEAEQYFKKSVPTDSAAAATAMSCGQKVFNGNICYDENNNPVKNIVDKINNDKKFNFAFVTTDLFYGATPAGFSSHNKSRRNYGQIAAEILSKTKPEIVAGKNEIYEMNNFAELNGYYVLKSYEINKPQVFSLTDKKIFLQLKKYYVPQPTENFLSESFQYRSDGTKFADIVLYATKIMLKKQKPFFVLIEDADIDKANHKNNYKKMLGAVYELNETVKSIYELINSKDTDMTFDNTVIMVTADHSTGMLRFNGYLSKGQLPSSDIFYNKNITVKTDTSISYKTKKHINELVGLYCIGGKIDLFDKYTIDKNIVDNTAIYKVLNDIIFVD